MNRNNGNLLYYFGQTKGYRGVGFYIKKHLEKRLIEVKGISERIAVAKIKPNETTNLAIIEVHAPTLGAPQKE